MKIAVNPFFRENLEACHIPLRVSNLGKDLIDLNEQEFWLSYNRVKDQLSSALLFFEVGTSAVLHFKVLQDSSDLFLHIQAKDLELLKAMIGESK